MRSFKLITVALGFIGCAIAAYGQVAMTHGGKGTPTTVTPTVDLNFASSTATGCASIAACITVTRATAETCTDASGNITYQTSGNACITTAGIQVWEASTNVQLHSAQDSGWTTTVGITSQSANATPPDGNSNTATTVTENASNSQHQVQGPTLSFTNGTVYVTSCFVKAGTRGFAQLTQNSSVQSGAGATNINLSTGAVQNVGTGNAGGSIAYASGWWRVWTKWTATGSATASMIFSFATAIGDARLPTYTGSSTTLLFWGCQVEASVAGPTPYIPTTTASVTRNATNIAVTGSSLLETTLNAATGSVVANTSAQMANLSATATTVVDSNGTVLLGSTTAAKGNTSVGASLTTGNTTTWASTSDLGLAWDASGGSLQLDSGTIATDATARTPATTFHLGSTSGSSAFFDGNITRIRAYNTKIASPQ